MEIPPIKKVTSFHNQKKEFENRPMINNIRDIESEMSEKLSEDEFQKDEKED